MTAKNPEPDGLTSVNRRAMVSAYTVRQHRPKMDPPMNRLTFALLLSLSMPLAQAQDPSPAEAPTEGEGERLELFDGDAEKNDEGWPRFALSLGYMWLEADGVYAIRGSGGTEVPIINFDRLGVDDKDGSPWVTLKWRSRSSNWGAWAAYWSFDGAGFRVWEDELDLGDGTLIPVGAGVATEFKTDWYILEATYSFIHNETWDVGIGAGFHVVDIDTTLAIGAQVGDESRVEQVARLDTLAPLPNILGYARWKLSDRWHATARYGWFGLSYDDYDGRMTNLHALLLFDLNDRWAFEAGYQFVKLDVDVNHENYTELFDMDFDGPMALVRFSF